MGDAMKSFGQAIGISPEPPPNRRFNNEIQRILAMGPALLSSQQELSPQYTALDLQNLAISLNGQDGTPGLLGQYSTNILPALTGAQNTANTATRTADVTDLSSLGPDAVSALRATNPQTAALIDTLTGQAESGLAAGNRIGPNDVYNIVNPVRSDWANRGLGGSMPAGLAEALQLYAGGNTLQRQRQGFAGDVAGLNSALLTQPALAFLRGNAASPAAGQNFLAGAGGFSRTPNVFDQLGGYASDLFNTNYNAQAAANIASANNWAALHSAVLGAGSKMGSAAM